MEYKITIDQKVVDEYNCYYFKQYPRARKPAIQRPIPVSLNQYLVMRRPQQNTIKQHWKDFICWYCKQLNYDNLMLDRFEVEMNIYMPTRRRFDLDNHVATSGKLIFDAFTECGFIVDDDSLHLTRLSVTGGYSKENPRTELVIKTI